MERNDLLEDIIDIERTFSFRDRYIRPEYLFGPLDKIGVFRLLSRAQLLQLSHDTDDLRMVLTSQQVQFDSPIGDYVPRAIEKCKGSFELPPIFVSELHDAQLVGAGALCLTNSGQVVLESTDNADLTPYKRNNAMHMIRDYAKSFAWGRWDQIELDEGPYFHMAGRWSQNYFHWLIDYLPQMLALQEYSQEVGERPTLILSSSPPDWLLESLSYFGFDADDWIEWGGGYGMVDRLAIGTHTRYGFFPSIGMIERLRSAIRTRVSPAGQMDRSRILISRTDADSRRLLNEREVMRRLRPLGVRRFVLSDLSLLEQIELFSRAETIIAPSGAGLANMMFADSPRVINLIGNNTNPCHYCLATGLGFEYLCVDAEADGLDMRVEPDVVADLIA